MAFKMNPISKNLRAGIDRKSNVHIEIWPIEFGWNRDIDPAISSSDPEEFFMASNVAFVIGDFLSRKKTYAINDVIDLHNNFKDEIDNEYDEGYNQALLDVRRILEDATT
jgi:hypothetical protein